MKTVVSNNNIALIEWINKRNENKDNNDFKSESMKSINNDKE